MSIPLQSMQRVEVRYGLDPGVAAAGAPSRRGMVGAWCYAHLADQLRRRYALSTLRMGALEDPGPDSTGRRAPAVSREERAAMPDMMSPEGAAEGASRGVRDSGRASCSRWAAGSPVRPDREGPRAVTFNHHIPGSSAQARNATGQAGRPVPLRAIAKHTGGVIRSRSGPHAKMPPGNQVLATGNSRMPGAWRTRRSPRSKGG